MLSESVRSYHQLFAAAKKPMLYASPWWLDTVCGDQGWDAIIRYNDAGEPIAALPYCFTKIRGLNAVITPPLTQWVSMISNQDVSLSSLSLVKDLPKSAILDLTIRPDGDLPVYDALFSVNLKYSFIIPGTSDMRDIRAGYNEGLRRNLKQAQNSYTIHQSEDVATFLALCTSTYHQRNMKPPQWLHGILPTVYALLQQNQCGMITLAFKGEKAISGIMTAWDAETSYYLAGGKTNDEQGASAHAFLLDQAIEASQRNGRTFDFEGSMHPGIANFFQSFGAAPFSYWQIRRFRGIGRLWSLFQ